MILTVTPNPCVDKTVFIDELRPGKFIHAHKCTCIPGGKGTNVSRAVKALGRETRALVVVGGHTGGHVVQMIKEQDGVMAFPAWVAAPTRTITTVLEGATRRQTAFFEPGPTVTAEERGNLEKIFSLVIGQAKVVTFNGTVPDRRLEGLYAELIPMAKDKGVITILDSHGYEFELGVSASPYMVKPNVAELEELVGHSVDTDADKWNAMDYFHDCGVKLVVLSLGKDGAFVSRDGHRLRVTPPNIDEVNPVGSGDAFVAGFAIGLMEDMPLEDMARLATAAGAANATSWDIGHFTKAEVDALMRRVAIERQG